MALVTGTRVLARLTWGLAAAAASLALAPAAVAHPFGPPQTAEVAAAGDRVEVRWRFGATDDISYLAAALEALPPARILLDGAVLYEEGDEELLAKAPAFADYLLQHVVVTRGGEACAGEIGEIDDLPDEGVAVSFVCPQPTGLVSVTIDMLTDLHPAYQTLATGPGGQRAVYAADAPSHDWELALTATAGDELAASAGRQITAVLVGLGALGALAGGGRWWLRQRRRSVISGAA